MTGTSTDGAGLGGIGTALDGGAALRMLQKKTLATKTSELRMIAPFPKREKNGEPPTAPLSLIEEQES
jgi:hypothetical protein